MPSDPKCVWYVNAPDGQTVTVIAARPEDAEQYAREHLCSDDSDGYDVVRAGDTGELRWVCYDDPGGSESDVRMLEQSGADIARVRVRYETSGLGSAMLWSVGAFDSDWCRCPDGVLCGGDE